MIENNQIISSEKLCGEIYELCKQISIQQKNIMDVLKIKFPEFYTENRPLLSNNANILSKILSKLTKDDNVYTPQISIPTDLVGDDNSQDKLNKELISPDLFSRLCYHLRSFSKSKEEIEDIVQDAIVKAYEKRHEYEERSSGNARAWISRIAWNTAIDYTRRKNETESIDSPDLDVDKRSILGVRDQDQKGENESRKKFFKKINLLLDQELTPYEKGLLLKLAQHKSYKEIAEEHGVPIGTIMANIFKAREKMRPHLDKLKADLIS